MELWRMKMLIVALQDDIDNLYAIWNTVMDRFLGVNLTRDWAMDAIIQYKHCSIAEANSRLDNPQPFSDIAKHIINGCEEGIYVKCPHCEEIRKLTPNETEKLLKTSKQVVSDCLCGKLYTVEIDNDAIFTH